MFQFKMRIYLISNKSQASDIFNKSKKKKYIFKFHKTGFSITEFDSMLSPSVFNLYLWRSEVLLKDFAPRFHPIGEMQ